MSEASPTTLDEYAYETDNLAIYPDAGEGTLDAIMYVALGLASEAGEVVGQIKRILRDDNGQVTDERVEKIIKELGDTQWYLARLCRELEVELGDVADTNLERLAERKKHGTLKGEGDDR